MSCKYNKEVAAAKSGMSAKTARKYLLATQLPSEMKKDRNWKTRSNVFSSAWHEIEDMLTKSPKLQATTILQFLISKDPDKFKVSHKRTLQKLMKSWRATGGSDKSVIFSQDLKPGVQSQSDYTVMNDLSITIARERFDHLLFHFMLPYSLWEHASICYSESLESLSKGYDDAVWNLGGVMPEHRTDNLSAATKAAKSKRVFTQNWQEVMYHYGVTPSRNNPGVSHENGSVEKSHDLLKKAIDQALMLRGSRDFSDKGQYQQFINEVVASRNSNPKRVERFEEELALLRPLPSKKYYAPLILDTTVSKFSTIQLLKVTYSVPSRLIGYKLRAYIYQGEIKLMYGASVIQTMPQIKSTTGVEASINYRHIIKSLLRKPGAFKNYVYRDHLFPNTSFRTAHDTLVAHYPVNGAKQYLQILQLAAMGSESEVQTILEQMMLNNEAPSFVEVEEQIKINHRSQNMSAIADIKIIAPSLESYDALLQTTVGGA
jgi:hypothetical protein